MLAVRRGRLHGREPRRLLCGLEPVSAFFVAPPSQQKKHSTGTLLKVALTSKKVLWLAHLSALVVGGKVSFFVLVTRTQNEDF